LDAAEWDRKLFKLVKELWAAHPSHGNALLAARQIMFEQYGPRPETRSAGRSKVSSLWWIARLVLSGQGGRQAMGYSFLTTLKKSGIQFVVFLALGVAAAIASPDAVAKFSELPFGPQVAGAVLGAISVALTNAIKQWAASKVPPAQ
jgi:hypothetical protein